MRVVGDRVVRTEGEEAFVLAALSSTVPADFSSLFLGEDQTIWRGATAQERICSLKLAAWEVRCAGLYMCVPLVFVITFTYW